MTGRARKGLQRRGACRARVPLLQLAKAARDAIDAMTGAARAIRHTPPPERGTSRDVAMARQVVAESIRATVAQSVQGLLTLLDGVGPSAAAVAPDAALLLRLRGSLESTQRTLDNAKAMEVPMPDGVQALRTLHGILAAADGTIALPVHVTVFAIKSELQKVHFALAGRSSDGDTLSMLASMSAATSQHAKALRNASVVSGPTSPWQDDAPAAGGGHAGGHASAASGSKPNWQRKSKGLLPRGSRGAGGGSRGGGSGHRGGHTAGGGGSQSRAGPAASTVSGVGSGAVRGMPGF